MGRYCNGYTVSLFLDIFVNSFFERKLIKVPLLGWLREGNINAGAVICVHRAVSSRMVGDSMEK
jgi:hypothetical protein